MLPVQDTDLLLQYGGPMFVLDPVDFDAARQCDGSSQTTCPILAACGSKSDCCLMNQT